MTTNKNRMQTAVAVTQHSTGSSFPVVCAVPFGLGPDTDIYYDSSYLLVG